MCPPPPVSAPFPFEPPAAAARCGSGSGSGARLLAAADEPAVDPVRTLLLSCAEPSASSAPSAVPCEFPVPPAEAAPAPSVEPCVSPAPPAEAAPVPSAGPPVPHVLAPPAGLGPSALPLVAPPAELPGPEDVISLVEEAAKALASEVGLSKAAPPTKGGSVVGASVLPATKAVSATGASTVVLLADDDEDCQVGADPSASVLGVEVADGDDIQEPPAKKANCGWRRFEMPSVTWAMPSPAKSCSVTRPQLPAPSWRGQASTRSSFQRCRWVSRVGSS